jgi:hypothetical protein
MLQEFDLTRADLERESSSRLSSPSFSLPPSFASGGAGTGAVGRVLTTWNASALGARLVRSVAFPVSVASVHSRLTTSPPQS